MLKLDFRGLQFYVFIKKRYFSFFKLKNGVRVRKPVFGIYLQRYLFESVFFTAHIVFGACKWCTQKINTIQDKSQKPVFGHARQSPRERHFFYLKNEKYCFFNFP